MHSTIARSLSAASTPRWAQATAMLLFVAACMRGIPLLALTPPADTSLRQNFLNPPAGARPMMRWWWFGAAVTHQELARELRQMHDVGIGGVEIQSVYPLSVDDASRGIKNLPYLSPAFLDAVRFANTQAAALGMRVDITLGSGWPFGGPHTSLEHAAGRLRVVTKPLDDSAITPPPLAPGESLIGAFQVQGSPDAYDAASARPLATYAEALRRRPRPTSALFFIASHTGQTVKRPAVGAEGLVLDHFSKDAIADHLRTVGSPLLAAFGSRPPATVFSDSLEVYGSDWTPNLLSEFQRRRGYNLLPHLPELARGGSADAEAVRHDWGVTLSELVKENYLVPIRDFAVVHRTRFRSQTYGEPAVTLSDQAVAALPEGEGPQWRTFSFTRWATSASHLYGRNVTSAETWTWLHSPAFRATPLDMKVEADRMFLQGVNQLVGHGWPYSPPGVEEPGWSLYAAAVFNTHNPWWPVMPDIVRYLHRASWLLRQGEPANDVAILLPEDDAQAAFSPGHVSVTDEMKERITPQLMRAVLDAGYNLDFTDPQTVDRRGIRHRILVVPPTHSLPLRTARAIAAYVAAGGAVIAIGELPSIAPGLLSKADSSAVASTMASLFHQANAAHIVSVADLPQALHRALPPDLTSSVRPSTGQDATAGLGFLHRRLANSDIYFVVNSSNQPLATSLGFRAAHESLEQWSLDSGAAIAHAGGDNFPIQLAPYESTVFVLHRISERVVADKAVTLEPATELQASWSIAFPGAQPQPAASIGSWTELPGRQNFSGAAIYRTQVSLHSSPKIDQVILDFGEGSPTIDTRPPEAAGIHANLDPPVREAAVIIVNGRRAGAIWHPPYRLEITSWLRPGMNHIEVHVFNTAINHLAGQPPRDYTALETRYGRRFVPQDMDHLEPVPSGLLHPVRIWLSHHSAKPDPKPENRGQM